MNYLFSNPYFKVWRPFATQTQEKTVWRPFDIHSEETSGDHPGAVSKNPGDKPGALDEPADTIHPTPDIPNENTTDENLPGDLFDLNLPGELPPGDLSINPGDDVFSKCDLCQKNFFNIHNMKMCVPCLVEENERLKKVVDNLMARETCKNCDRTDN